MKRRRLLLLLAALPAGLGLVLWPFLDGFGVVGFLWSAYTLTIVFAALLWLGAVGLRWFLWRVGRRLAFSYAMIGIVPIPLAVLLALVTLYIGSGFLLGHLYRDTVQSLAAELRGVAAMQLEHLLRGDRRDHVQPLPITFALYRDGVKLGGFDEAPATWQEWWDREAASTTAAPAPSNGRFVAGPDGEPTLVATAHRDGFSLLAVFSGDLDGEIAQRSGIWVELARADEGGGTGVKRFQFFDRELILKAPRLGWDRPEVAELFHPGNAKPTLAERPTVFWVEISSPFRDLSTGEERARYVTTTLTGNLLVLRYHLFPSNTVFDAVAYSVFFVLAYLLALLWMLAMATAVPLIYGLSTAFNTLYGATRRVQGGDFSARVRVHRNDQIGELQTSFNQMTANLEKLVKSAAQKEILERELAMAREVQRSLLPGEVVGDEALRFATHFAPSAAIGGDYFDLLPLGDGASSRLAVAVADVSGHGLSAGLRMAMVKSALELLCAQDRDPEEILLYLDRQQRSAAQRGGRPGLTGSGSVSTRGFVTATLAVLDRATGEMLVTNAGHPPTYLLRDGHVREISPPGTPLGALGESFGQERVTLRPGDLVVWLSDGLVEAVDAADEPFGYDGVTGALESFAATGGAIDAVQVRDHLLAALAEHSGGRAPEDDQTLVVMAYRLLDLEGAVAAGEEEVDAVSSASVSGRPRAV